MVVSTHSRPKAAGNFFVLFQKSINSFNTQPPEGGWSIAKIASRRSRVSTHSRPKAAGTSWLRSKNRRLVSTHSRPKAAGWWSRDSISCRAAFQHTAARRRLVSDTIDRAGYTQVSTHSRPKAAGGIFFGRINPILGFNTQPPEGGWAVLFFGAWCGRQFQHTAARRRLVFAPKSLSKYTQLFQHTAARRRLGHMRADLRLFCLCFNTQPPEGGWRSHDVAGLGHLGFNTQPPEGGWRRMSTRVFTIKWFQHTAARRRLEMTNGQFHYNCLHVSTHSRPKAAG